MYVSCTINHIMSILYNNIMTFFCDVRVMRMNVLEKYCSNTYNVVLLFFSYSCGGERRDEQFIGCTDGFTEYICNYCSVIETTQKTMHVPLHAM